MIKNTQTKFKEIKIKYQRNTNHIWADEKYEAGGDEDGGRDGEKHQEGHFCLHQIIPDIGDEQMVMMMTIMAMMMKKKKVIMIMVMVKNIRKFDLHQMIPEWFFLRGYITSWCHLVVKVVLLFSQLSTMSEWKLQMWSDHDGYGAKANADNTASAALT